MQAHHQGQCATRVLYVNSGGNCMMSILFYLCDFPIKPKSTLNKSSQVLRHLNVLWKAPFTYSLIAVSHCSCGVTFCRWKVAQREMRCFAQGSKAAGWASRVEAGGCQVPEPSLKHHCPINTWGEWVVRRQASRHLIVSKSAWTGWSGLCAASWDFWWRTHQLLFESLKIYVTRKLDCWGKKRRKWSCFPAWVSAQQ